VKGHQDDNTSYDKLTLQAQLNVDVDHEANNFQWNHTPTLLDLVPISPHTHAQLNIDGRTISGHYRHHIRTASSQDAFFAQCREIHEWIPSVFKLIHLPTLRSAVRHSCSRSIFTFKFLHCLLPTQSTKQVWYNYNPCCPLCMEDDTQVHFMRYMHPIAQAWRRTFLRTIRATMNTLHAAHDLQVVLTDALEVWLDGENIDHRGYPRK
jgi:hypothetical protein